MGPMFIRAFAGITNRPTWGPRWPGPAPCLRSSLWCGPAGGRADHRGELPWDLLRGMCGL